MRKALLSLLAAASLGACSSLPDAPKLSLPTKPRAAGAEKVPVSVPGEATAREHVDRAIVLMGAGKAEEASALLQSALVKLPKDTTASRLLAQIETDPAVLLGPATAEHVVVAGDTMSVLAERYVGDPLMFYALAKYNGLAAPNALRVGKVLKIPARPAQPAIPAASAPESRATPAAAPPEAADAEKASAVRLLGLQSLNQGDVARAVRLLKEAQSLDGTDPAIRKDLERAMRIQSALTDG